MSSTPSPRPSVAPEVGRTCHLSAPVARSLISPSNRFGSGSARVASVPVISTKPCRGSGDSKLSTSVATGPCAYSIRAETWVGTSTRNSVPARGPLAMTLVSRLRRPTAATCSAGPKIVASTDR